MNGQRTGISCSQQTLSDPSGTTVRSSTQNLGEPAVEETRHYDSQGRELLENRASTGGQQGRISDLDVEDVTDSAQDSEVDRQYSERIEDEYAKREGGA